MKKIIIRIVAAVICLGAIAAGLVYYLSPDTLKVTAVERGTISPRLAGTGIVEGDRKLTVYSDVSGVIDDRFVDPGDRVKKGDPLIGYSGESQQDQVDLAATDVEYSEKILGAATDSRESYQSKLDTAKKKISECEQVYALLEQQIMSLNSGVYLSDYELKERKKSCEAEVANIQGEIAKDQARLSKVESDLKSMELKGVNTDEQKKEVDEYVQKAKKYQEEIGDMNKSISGLQRDVICLPQEGMDPKTHDRYLVLQNNLDTVMRIWTEAKTDRDTSQSMLTAYQEIYSDEQQVERNKLTLTQAEKELAKAAGGSTAPADGVITACLVDEGAYVDKGHPVIEMQTSGGYKVKMMVSKYDIPSVHEGQKADIALGNVQYTGTVSKINQAAENDSSGKAKASVEITVDTGDDLIVGLEADVTVLLEDTINILKVPVECVYSDDDGSFVYVVDDEQKVMKKYVTTGLKDSLYIEIEGLDEGAHVISDPDAGTHVGEKIKEEMQEADAENAPA
ncbi:MAG: HlyD family efflux transporter periplasmic adaptor subunit [Lachnospiraceae bacterium]|nr:HlyD family efflux transporter periplasmic adaptor subunit [Lachnospiraceae bacterium]